VTLLRKVSANDLAKSMGKTEKEDEMAVREESAEKTIMTTDGNVTAVAVAVLNGIAAIVRMGDTATTAVGSEVAAGIDIVIAVETAVMIDREGTTETADAERATHVLCERETEVPRHLSEVLG
jgi:hypothetical protein